MLAGDIALLVGDMAEFDVDMAVLVGDIALFTGNIALLEDDMAVTTATGCRCGLLKDPNPKLGLCLCKLLPEDECSNELPIRDVPARKYSDIDPDEPLFS